MNKYVVLTQAAGEEMKCNYFFYSEDDARKKAKGYDREKYVIYICKVVDANI